MCIIVYKPNTSNFPKKDILKTAFQITTTERVICMP